MDYPFLVLAPVLGLIINVAVHFLISRRTRAERHLFAIIISFLIGLGCEIAFTIRSLGLLSPTTADYWAYHVINLAIYGALGFGYSQFVILNFASLRIRMLREIHSSKDGCLSEAALLAEYNAEIILATRLERLVEWEQLSEKDGRYFIRKKTLLSIARCFDFLKWMILGQSPKGS